jgi:hypothetical protein
MSIETLPLTDLGSAAAAVVDKMPARRGMSFVDRCALVRHECVMARSDVYGQTLYAAGHPEYIGMAEVDLLAAQRALADAQEFISLLIERFSAQRGK